MLTDSVAVFSLPDTPKFIEQAIQLAAELSLPFIEHAESGPQYLLTITENRIELRPNPKIDNSLNFSPLYVDFVSGSSGYRHARNCTTKQPLARAVGIKPGFRPTITDTTAGLGGDGFVLACLGCQVHLVERSPVFYALLRDGIQRAEQDSKTRRLVQENMQLTWANGINFLDSHSANSHTIYLDPMYPHSTKAALNKKEMRIIRDIVGDDTDGSKLLHSALCSATNRVVVKRPKGAEHLSGMEPSHEILMKNSRFDVYLTNHL